MLTVKWLKNPQDLNDAFFIREMVFIKEQGFRNEFDVTDNTCGHLVLYEDGKAEARARELGAEKICPSAQVQAGGFYRRLGYRADSEPYLDEHCPHVRMEKTL